MDSAGVGERGEQPLLVVSQFAADRLRATRSDRNNDLELLRRHHPPSAPDPQWLSELRLRVLAGLRLAHGIDPQRAENGDQVGLIRRVVEVGGVVITPNEFDKRICVVLQSRVADCLPEQGEHSTRHRTSEALDVFVPAALEVGLEEEVRSVLVAEAVRSSSERFQDRPLHRVDDVHALHVAEEAPVEQLCQRHHHEQPDSAEPTNWNDHCQGAGPGLVKSAPRLGVDGPRAWRR